MLGEAQALRAQAIALHKDQRLIEAEAAIAQAALLSPQDPVIAFMAAQFRYELGYDAADHFGRAQALWPDNAELVRNHALALQSEGRVDAARGLLETLLAANPTWLAGHKALAALNWTEGAEHAYATSFSSAARAHPDHEALWLGWFQAKAQIKDWAGAGAILDEAQGRLGSAPAFRSARLFLACESGAHDAAAFVAENADLADDTSVLACIRHHLRAGDATAAEVLCQSKLASRSANLFWPYLALCWRLSGDVRADWLNDPGRLIQAREDVLAAGELEELMVLLRSLHLMQRPYVEQSVRGGTQTDRSVLLRHEPILQRTRAALEGAIADYVAALPPVDPSHPFLGRPREHTLRISGSWSVRLLPGGHNVPHTHPMGWISTAFYVALPDAISLDGDGTDGWIEFGRPPPELGIGLPALTQVQPKPGRLVMFPFMQWHGTLPFDSGERLVIAFDMV